MIVNPVTLDTLSKETGRKDKKKSPQQWIQDLENDDSCETIVQRPAGAGTLVRAMYHSRAIKLMRNLRSFEMEQRSSDGDPVTDEERLGQPNIDHRFRIPAFSASIRA